MSKGAPLTREESQAQTRRLILRSAEDLFLANGFHATTVAAIARNAGRTQGSIYSNFAGKEVLCGAVLEHIYAGQAERLMVELAGPRTVEAKLAQLGEWWSQLAADSALTLLVTEYSLAVRNDAEQRLHLERMLQFALAAVRAGLTSTVGNATRPQAEQLDDAVTSILATGVGLAMGQVSWGLDPGVSTRTFVESVRAWAHRLDLLG